MEDGNMRVRTFDPFMVDWGWDDRGVKPAMYQITLLPGPTWDHTQIRITKTLYRTLRKPLIILDETRVFSNDDFVETEPGFGYWELKHIQGNIKSILEGLVDDGKIPSDPYIKRLTLKS